MTRFARPDSFFRGAWRDGDSRKKDSCRAFWLFFCVGLALAFPAVCGADGLLGTAPVLEKPPANAGAQSPVRSVAQGLSVDIRDRAAVVDFWNNVYKSSEGVAIDWTGSVATCTAGTTNPDFTQATLQRVNYFRAMAQLPGDITLDSTLNAKCEEAALMMAANQSLNHAPPDTWLCYTTDGFDAAGHSNLALGAYGPRAIDLYMSDTGQYNYAVGHRRWILYPPLVTVGTGSNDASPGLYPGADALWVIGAFGTRPPAPEWVSWPPPGYVPYPIVPGRWSFSYPQADFDNATVTMTQGGMTVSVTLEPVDNSGYGDRTVVWVPAISAGANPGQDTTYSVTVQNVVVDSTPRQFQYDVTIIDPDASGPTPTATPSPTATTSATPTATPSSSPGAGLVVY